MAPEQNQLITAPKQYNFNKFFFVINTILPTKKLNVLAEAVQLSSCGECITSFPKITIICKDWNF